MRIYDLRQIQLKNTLLPGNVIHQTEQRREQGHVVFSVDDLTRLAGKSIRKLKEEKRLLNGFS